MTPTDPNVSERRSFLKMLGGLTAAFATLPAALSGQGSALPRAAGAATPRMRGPRQSSSAFLAFAESWLKLP